MKAEVPALSRVCVASQASAPSAMCCGRAPAHHKSQWRGVQLPAEVRRASARSHSGKETWSMVRDCTTLADDARAYTS